MSAPQTYCSASDVQDILSTAGYTAFLDDDESGTLSAGETTTATNMIERAAVRMNGYVCQRYKLSEVTANQWLRWGNATLAAALIVQRRNNPLNQALGEDVKYVYEFLEAMTVNDKVRLPEQNDSFETYPTVSNFDVERARGQSPVRVSPSESTGSAPTPPITRRVVRPLKHAFDW